MKLIAYAVAFATVITLPLNDFSKIMQHLLSNSNIKSLKKFKMGKAKKKKHKEALLSRKEVLDLIDLIIDLITISQIFQNHQ